MRGGPLPAPSAVDAAGHQCLQPRGGARRRTAQAALASLVSARLLGQSLRPSLLARAVPRPQPVPARDRSRPVARGHRLGPALAHGRPADDDAPDGRPGPGPGPGPAGRPAAPLLVLDSLRCGGWEWEVFTLGRACDGRVLVVGWALLPSPWPKGRFTPTVGALRRQVAAAWPPAAPVPQFQLVADRAFPSTPLGQPLGALGGGDTLRRRAAAVVTTAAGVLQGCALPAAATPEAWSVPPGRCGRHPDPGPTTRVVGRGLTLLPAHQRDRGSGRARARRRAPRRHGVQQPRRPSPTAPWLILLSTPRRAPAAGRAYRPRAHTEGS